ncbi:ribonuclease H-like domain-containing protein [Tanacetum coccineum]
MDDMLPLGVELEEEELLVKELLKLMCDKKNSVLFTDTTCFVLSPDFKLPDESQVLLKVPRKNNMYSVDMKNIVPKQSLTCLVAKATLDESMLWHIRLGHINFKTINKLVKDNLMRGLPAKHFENDQTYEGRLILSICSQEWMEGHVGDEAVHKELGGRMERAATTASSIEAEQDSDSGPRCQDTKLGGVDAQTSTSENGEMEITATIDGRVKTITKASIRRHLMLEDSDGISTLPNTEIFEQLALMGYVSNSGKLTFQKGHFSP